MTGWQPGDQPPGEPAAGTRHPSYVELSVGDFLDALAAPAPAPAGGSAAALVVAQAAALCVKTARLSARQLPADRARSLTAEGERIRAAAASLIDADAQAYRGVIEATRPVDTPGAAGDAGPDQRRHGGALVDRNGPEGPLAAALSHASDVPMRVVELAASVSELAASLAAAGNPALRGDAIAAVLLAQAGARSATTLVSINLAAAPEDPRHASAEQLLADIAHFADSCAA